MTITDHPTAKLSACPAWCNIDHEKQQREIDRLSRFPGENSPWHSRNLAEGFDTRTHGPLYSVALENSEGATRLYVALEAGNINADQAEVLGLALVRAASMLRASGDAQQHARLNTYFDGTRWVTFEPEVIEPTAAELALSLTPARAGKETA